MQCAGSPLIEPQYRVAENGLITEELGLDYGRTALRQLGLIKAA